MTDRDQPILFVSHHSSQLETAEHVERALNAQGIRCWIAPRDVDPGEPFDRAVRNAIADTDAVLLLFSSASEKSRHVKRELILADQVGKAIIPLRLERIKPGELSYHLADSQWIDWLERRDEAIARIAAKAREFHDHAFETSQPAFEHPPAAAAAPPVPLAKPAPPAPTPTPAAVDLADAAPAHSAAIGAGADLQPHALGAFAGPSPDAPPFAGTPGADAAPHDDIPPAEPPRRGSLLWLWILIGVVIVAGGAGLAWYLMSRSGGVTEDWFEGQWSQTESCERSTRYDRDGTLVMPDGTRGTWSIDNGRTLVTDVDGGGDDLSLEEVDEDTVLIDGDEYYRCR